MKDILQRLRKLEILIANNLRDRHEYKDIPPRTKLGEATWELREIRKEILNMIDQEPQTKWQKIINCLKEVLWKK